MNDRDVSRQEDQVELQEIGALLKQASDRLLALSDRPHMNTPIACPEPLSPVAGAVHECFGFNLLDRINSFVKPDLTRQVDRVVNSLSEMQTLINSRTDHLGEVYQLAAGTYNTQQTAIDVTGKRNLTVYSDASDRAVIDMSTAGAYTTWGGIAIRTRDSDNIEILNFGIQNSRGHGIWAGSDNSSETAGSNIYIAGNVITNTCNSYGAAIVVRSGGSSGSSGFVIECNEIYSLTKTNPVTGTNNRGEGIYIGSGNDAPLWVSDVVIRGNRIYDLTAEAIDIKRDTRRVEVSYNLAYEIEVSSQGAVVIGLDPGNNVADYDGAISVFRNTIHDITTRAFDGVGLVIAIGDAHVYENLIFNTADEAISVYRDCNRGSDDVLIEYNILWGYGSGGPVNELGNANNGTIDPCNVTRRFNIVEDQAASNDCVYIASDFQGPLNQVVGFNPAA